MEFRHPCGHIHHPPLAHHMNLELLSTLEWFVSLTEQVQYGCHPILSEPINFTTALLPPSSQLSQEEGEDSSASEKQEEFTLQSGLLYPIFENFVPDAAIQGYLVAVLPWENYFLNVLQVQKQEELQAEDGSHENNHNTDNNQHGDVGSNKFSLGNDLPPPVLIQLQEWACHDMYLNFIMQGPFAHFIGYGSLHDAKYKGLAKSTSFATFTHESLTTKSLNPNNTNATTASASDSSSYSLVPFNLCMHDFILTVYPMAAFEASYHTKKPTLYMAMVLSMGY